MILRQCISHLLYAIGFACLCIAHASHAANTTPANSARVSLVFAGDIVLDGAPGASIEQGRDPFEGVRAIFADADIRLGNLECVIAETGTPEEKNFTFRAHPRVIPVLKRYLDGVMLANNHSGDFGRTAFVEMLSRLEQASLPYAGGGHNLEQAHRPLLFERKGLHIAVLAYDEFMPRSFEAGSNWAGVAWSEDEQVVADIRAARTMYHADIVVTVMHWGWENETQSSDRQHRLAHAMIDAGADAVLGGHPHVIQDTEIYRNRPIIYSVGNFMIDSLDQPANMQGWAVRLEFDGNGAQAYRSLPVQLNEQGIPSMSGRPAQCWQRGQTADRICPAIR